MEFTVRMAKEYKGGGFHRVEIMKDSNYCLGRCRGKGDYVVMRQDRKYYRMKSMIDEYKYWKSVGYKVVWIDVDVRRKG